MTTLIHEWHRHPLTFNDCDDDGWCCDGRNQTGGCRRGITGFGQTRGIPRYHCSSCDFDLCDQCALKDKPDDNGMKWLKFEQDQPIPSNAVMAGYESNGYPIYVTRVNYHGSSIFGHTGSHLNCSIFGNEGLELESSDFEILIADSKQLCHLNWQIHQLKQKFRFNAIGFKQPSEGSEPTNDKYIGRTKIYDSILIANVDKQRIKIPVCGKEIRLDKYEILVLELDT